MGKGQRNRNKRNIEKQTSEIGRDKIIMSYYRKNPALFIEEYLDVKLTRFQRFVLKHMKLKGDNNA